MKYSFPIPKRIIADILLAALSIMLIFAVLSITEQLTAGREEFNDTDWRIFWGMIAVEVVLFSGYIVFLADSGYLIAMRRRLIRKYREHFAEGESSLVYQPYDLGGTWMDSGNKRRAIGYCEKKLHIVLIEHYNEHDRVWAADAMRVYDSTEEIERSLRSEYGFEIEGMPEASKAAEAVVRGAKPNISVGIEDCDV